jgi:hypothetical protein
MRKHPLKLRMVHKYTPDQNRLVSLAYDMTSFSAALSMHPSFFKLAEEALALLGGLDEERTSKFGPLFLELQASYQEASPADKLVMIRDFSSRFLSMTQEKWPFDVEFC